MKPEKKQSTGSFFKTFILTVGVVLLFINFIAHPVRVVGSSMYPTLEDGDYGFTNIIGTKISKPKRNDVVIVTMQEEDGTESQWIKRIIGMPNDTIECIHDEIYVNQKKIDESDYIDEKYKNEMIEKYGYFNQYPVNHSISDWGPVQLSDDEYFVMGDNRPCSSDSRNPNVGPVKEKQIYGKSMLVLFPISKMGWN